MAFVSCLHLASASLTSITHTPHLQATGPTELASLLAQSRISHSRIWHHWGRGQGVRSRTDLWTLKNGPVFCLSTSLVSPIRRVSPVFFESTPYPSILFTRLRVPEHCARVLSVPGRWGCENSYGYRSRDCPADENAVTTISHSQDPGAAWRPRPGVAGAGEKAGEGGHSGQGHGHGRGPKSRRRPQFRLLNLRGLWALVVVTVLLVVS